MLNIFVFTTYQPENGVKYGSKCTDFQETQQIDNITCRHLVSNFTHVVRNTGSKDTNTFSHLSMTVAVSIFMKLMLVRLFVTNYQNEFHKNLTKVLVSDTTSQTGVLAGGQTGRWAEGRTNVFSTYRLPFVIRR